MTSQQATEITHAAMLGLGVHRPERVVTTTTTAGTGYTGTSDRR